MSVWSVCNASDVPQENTFASRLVSAMGARQMTVAELHEALGEVVSLRSLWRWRSGASVPGLEIVPALCRVLGVTANYIVGIEETT